MQMRPLGRTGVQVSALGFGCMGLIGWYGVRDDAEATATLLAAVDAGLTHFDTAQSYQNGANEQFVGTVLANALKSRRERIFLASKYGITRDAQGAMVIDNQPAALRTAVDLSLTRLGVEHIDLYYLHRIDQRVPIEESVGQLAEMVRAGKIRHIGLSECSSATLRRAHAVHPIAAVQNEYSLWVRDPEAGVLGVCRELGVGLVAYSPLGRGFLAGDFRRTEDLPADDARRNQPRFQAAAGAHNLQLVDALRDCAAQKRCTVAQLAIAWVLHQGSDVLPIPGTKKRARLSENLGALQVTLSPTECAELGALVSRIGVLGDRHPPAMMKVLNG
ncbi:MAG: aldo/keto reductase [Steroidobacteraceae bacterium]